MKSGDVLDTLRIRRVQLAKLTGDPYGVKKLLGVAWRRETRLAKLQLEKDKLVRALREANRFIASATILQTRERYGMIGACSAGEALVIRRHLERDRIARLSRSMEKVDAKLDEARELARAAYTDFGVALAKLP